MANPRQPRPCLLLLALSFLAVFVWSGWQPRDRFTWVLEIWWTAVGFGLLLGTGRRFPLTTLLYTLLWIHAVVLLVGGHYTYEHVPLFDWIRDRFHLKRNNYDRLGHLMQGFVPAILAREILWRRSPLAGSRWLPFLCGSIALAFSAFFELIEWQAAVAFGSGADAYLATQGDPWDTQWDMCCALIGAIVALTLLSKFHERQLRALSGGYS
jgi:putative membrane protein